MTYHLPIWVLLGILAAAVASTQADAQQVQQDDILFAEEQLRRSGSQATYDQFIDEETGQRRQQVFDDADVDDSDSPEDVANTSPRNVRQDALAREPPPEGNARTQRVQQVSIVDAAGEITPLANTPVAPVQPLQGAGLRRINDPFAPLGIRRGSFLLFPSLTQTIGFTDNADFEANGEESAFSLTSARLRLLSDWSIHQFSADVGGSYQAFFNDTSDDLPVIDGNAELRLDHTRDFTTRWGGSFQRTTESTASNNLSSAVVIDRPGVLQGSVFGEAQKQAGRLTGNLRGTVTRTVFEDADLSDGGTLSQDDRNNTQLTAALRVGYETSPAIQPFVEGIAGLRRFDESVDRNGEQRDSLQLSLRGGFAFSQGEKVNGEFAVGYSTEDFDDPALETLSGVTFDGTINWSPERFTTITATVQTAFAPSTNAGESGSITYGGTLGVTRDVRPNLTLNARVLASLREFEGSDREDRTLQGRFGGEWRLNRSTAILGELGYETVDSTDANSSFEALTARLGLRLQR